ncbi:MULTISPECIES: hypothetical protein [unclassified Sphingomonas]|uniref:hypothetical protein n=1 Tax=unclassified Sphingomonas TaxID=196159 RepID=UPI00037D8AC8|nr:MULTISPECIES: hypothetical protein [unclassified Sphingomonas]
MRISRNASVLALALAACGGTAPEAPANASNQRAAAPPAAVPVAGGEAAYADCQTRANGDASALVACADSAIATAGRGVDSPEAAAAFRAALQELGDAAAEGGGTAARVTFARSAVHLARQRAALLSGASPARRPSPAPAVTSETWAKSRALSCRAHPVPRCTARYDALLPLLTPSPAKAPAMASAAPITGLPLPSCQEVQASGKIGGALADAFYARYPKALAGEASVEQLALDPAALDNVVRYLVCVAGATDYDPVVAENAFALFASRRHGAAASHALSALARSSDPAAGAARRFDAQISGYLHHPG